MVVLIKKHVVGGIFLRRGENLEGRGDFCVKFMEITGVFFPRGGENFPRNYEGRRNLYNHFKRGVEILGANFEGRRNISLIFEISLHSLVSH